MDSLHSKLRRCLTKYSDLYVQRPILAIFPLAVLGSVAYFAFYKITESEEHPTLARSQQGSLTDRALQLLNDMGRFDLLDTRRNCQTRLPECIIIGVMKAGTGAFAMFLAIHPEVAMQLNMPSTKYFSSNYNAGQSWYKDMMLCSTDDQITIDKGPQYFRHFLAPERIYRMNPNMKLILLVRHPVHRAVSQFLQECFTGHNTKYKVFEDCAFTNSGEVNELCSYIRMSSYSTILKEWFKYFPRKQFLILDGDKFKADQIGVLSEAEQFLGIRKYITPDKFVFDEARGFYSLPKLSLDSGKGRIHPNLTETQWNSLKAYFKPYNEELYKMIGIRFNW